jgi:hypothetical protein
MFTHDIDETQYYTDDERAEKKIAFARALLLSPMDPAKAARSIEPRSSHIAFILAHWQYDAEVNKIMENMVLKDGAKAKLPSKDEFAASLISEAADCRDKETKLDYLKLFASVMGYVEKSGVAVTTNNTINNVKNNVILLPTPIKGETLEMELMEHQRKLIANERD